ncbi:MAG: thermonuclease family protein [Candidatus Omnitrophica bacterium]|nr:thermonuclease family protein [Candidatus Omnitrophota bacterium]MBU4478537.1 thermonuclease family protein [Candidatus Omnitrophota bacterium]MCG2702866.1 thermonuclease family protein [Candidatus Omnitrophota bacterium]
MKSIIKSLIVILVLLNSGMFLAYAEATAFILARNERSVSSGSDINKEQYYNIQVKEVLEGDTLLLENGKQLKLLGVDTPENQKCTKLLSDAKLSGIQTEVLEVMANEALQFTRNMVEGKRICVEFEETQADRYGTLLGYVYIIGEDVFLNAEIIKQGYTPLVNLALCLRYQDLFKELHEDIVSKSSGVWKQWMEIK